MKDIKLKAQVQVYIQTSLTSYCNFSVDYVSVEMN